MEYRKRQTIGIFVLLFLLLALAGSIMYFAMQFYDDKELFIVVEKYDNSYDYYSTNKYSIKQINNFSILVYDRSDSNNQVEYKGWEFRNFDIIEKQDLPGK